MSPRARFWSKVEETDGCWLWRGARQSRGGVQRYGTVSVGGATVLAHRLAWRFEHGPVPEGAHLLHSCNEPACVRVEHLRIGTHADNMLDKVRANRQRAKLTPDRARLIRELYATGLWTHRELGQEFGVSHRAVGHVLRGQSWGHIGTERMP